MRPGPAVSAGREIACEAPAKVNLALHVTGRRPDGYHLLDTLAVFAGAADRVSAAPAPETRLDISGPFAAGLEAGPGNLVLLAAGALADRLPGGVAFRLAKCLPVASGIGGGSADAAAALRLLAGLCDPVPSSEELLAVALRLGADVPMCLDGVPLRASGIGEEIALLPAFPRLSLVLVNPGVPVSTAAVFRRLGGRFGPALPDPAGLRDLPDLLDWLSAARNDLEAPAVEVEPAVGGVLAALRRSPGCLASRMSGSGATCFGIYADAAAAEGAAARLREDHPGWWVSAGPTRTSRPEIVRSGG